MIVDVALGLPVPGTYSYTLPPGMGAAIGARVLVPFGARGVTGVVVRQHEHAPAGQTHTVRAVRDVLDELPALEPALVDLCMWVAEYYEAPPGEVIRAALPAGTAEGFRARVKLTASGQAALAGGAAGALSARARRALGVVAAGRRPRTADVVDELCAAGLVSVVDERQEARVRVRMVATARLARPPTDAEREKIARAPRRAELLALLSSEPGGAWSEVPALAARVKGAAGAVRALAAMGIVEKGRQPKGRASPAAVAAAPRDPLSPTAEQAAALAEIHAAVAAGGFHPFLLHGVTGSGKTEVYLQSIAGVLAAGKSAIVLVPEIALTPQLAGRFRARFGDQVAVLHSGLSDGERLRQWRRLRSGEARIALGARSAVFAPVADVGMIVVDEEHDPSFKQEEGVRYHARDVALVRAQRAGAVCVLGSATPALESYARALEGKYRLLVMAARAHARPLPAVDVVDLRVYRPDGEAMLSAPLDKAIGETLAAGNQTILFLNRRGFATFVLCCGCGHSFRCPQCSVSLTYHKQGDRLRCHYCGHAEPVPFDCPKCGGSETIRRLGLGTERIEEALKARYPGARVARLDRDTAAGNGLRDLLERFSRREIDILVGTQMVTKGHDFPGVTLVGVLCADSALSLPDFRAGERTFQLLTQVAGRAGRGEDTGRVIIQTWAPEHPAVRCAQAHDYQAFFAAESIARAELGYPPRGRLVAVRIDGSDEHEVRAFADELALRGLKLGGPVTMLGPAEAPLRRLRGRTRWHLWVKGEDRAALRDFVRRLLDRGTCGPLDEQSSSSLPPLSSECASPTLGVLPTAGAWPGQQKRSLGSKGKKRGDLSVTVDVDPISAL